MKKIIDKVALIHIQDQKILSTLSKNKDTFYLPGGKRENNESDIDCLKREIKEELDVDIVDDSIKFLGCFEAPAHGHPDGVIVKMLCYFANYSGTLKPNNEIEFFQWLQYSDKNKTSSVDQIIFDTLKEQKLIK